MEIKITSKLMLKLLHIISWIIFIGLCIEAGGILFNSFYTLIVNPLAAKNFWGETDLSTLLNADEGYFLNFVIILSIVAILKSILFYSIVKILHDKKIDLSRPFNADMTRFISGMGYLALGIGLFSNWGVNYNDWLIAKNIAMPTITNLDLGGADVWVFMGIILMVVSQMFKRGVEIQSENELTI